MEIKCVEAEDGWFKCPDCDCLYDKVDSLRHHTERVHGFKISAHRPVPIEVRRERGKRYTAAWRERIRGRKSKRIKSKGTQRAPFDIDDAKLHGKHGCIEPFVEYRTSLIEGAGNGIFAVEDLHPGDIVTWFAGPKTTVTPEVRTHTIQFEDGVYIDGLRQPVFGDGLGSFINRESRKLSKTRKNCEFVREGDMMAVEITKKIKAGQELYTTYSRGYRIRGAEE